MLIKNRITNLAITLLLVFSFIGVPISVYANEDPINPSEEITENPLLKDAELYAKLNEVSVEEALIRLDLQDVAGELDAVLTETEADTFAGLWIEHTPEFKVVVLFTKDGDMTIQKYLTEELANITEVRTAEKTLSELINIQTKFSDSLKNLDIAADLYTDIHENCVKVSIANSDYSIFNNYLNQEKLIIPEKVNIEFVDELSKPNTTIYGGLHLEGIILEESTCGFAVEDASGNKGVTAAGHCSNSQWWGINWLVFEEEEWEGFGDIQWHSTNMDVDNLIRDSSSYTTREITSSKSRSQQAVGSFVGKYGRATGYTAGYIECKTAQPTYVPNCEPTFILVEHSFPNLWDKLADQGDSGGPWFVGNTAWGTHSGTYGEYGVYMAINYLSEINVSLLTD